MRPVGGKPSRADGLGVASIGGPSLAAALLSRVKPTFTLGFVVWRDATPTSRVGAYVAGPPRAGCHVYRRSHGPPTPVRRCNGARPRETCSRCVGTGC